MAINHQQFKEQWFRRFGTTNPERMNIPFWMEMVASGEEGNEPRGAWEPRRTYNFNPDGPVWCFQRFGMTRTRLPDGRIVHIAGEHEDFYDTDFCIYNDVIVRHIDGTIEIFGYPREVFPPTDFHSATFTCGGIIIIGSFGYKEERRPGETPVYRLDVKTLFMSRIETGGNHPGWISGHDAVLDNTGKGICIWGGKVLSEVGGKLVANRRGFRLDLENNLWSRIPDDSLESTR